MSFTELRYFACLVPAVILFYGLPIRWRSGYLLILSFLFYLTWSFPYAVLLLLLTLLVYFVALAADRASSDRTRQLTTMSAILLPVGILAGFKILSPLSLLVRPLWGDAPPGFVRNLIIPLGISYYTFKLISYVLDVYWGRIKAEASFVSLALYVAFFPQILCGPIQRAPDFLKQLKTSVTSGLNIPMFDRGIGFVLLGLLQKLVIADRIAPFVAQVDLDLASQSGLTVLLSVYCYTLQLFADFSALTLIALGTGMLFGIQGPPNFNRPFAASNIQEFWRRWHMSLTGWLADYLFLPLRMTFRKWGNWGLYISIVLNMAIIGLWHGITANFVVFGLIHGVLMVSSAVTANWRNGFFGTNKRLEMYRSLWGQLITFHLVALAFVFFRASSIGASVQILRRIAETGSTSGIGTPPGGDVVRAALAASLVALMLGYGLLSRNLEDFLVRAKGWPLYLAYGMALFAIVLLGAIEGGQFIYARF